MEVLFVLAPFVVAGLTVIFIAFSGGPAAAREAYLTRGQRFFRIAIPLVYVAFGAAVPAVVIASRGESEGEVGKLRTEALGEQQKEGKRLFRQTCWSCHNLDAAGAQGVTGPDLDELGVDRERVLNAIRRGGTGDGRMPASLLQGEDAQHVAAYVAKVAGQ
jgi:mono/diheme cytochrome c family protein